MAKTRHKSLRTVQRYVKPGPAGSLHLGTSPGTKEAHSKARAIESWIRKVEDVELPEE
jgi:hypothetical protein